MWLSQRRPESPGPASSRTALFWAGQVGLGEHAQIGPGVILGGGAGVLSHKKVRGPGQVFWGRPARPLKQYLRDLAGSAGVSHLRELWPLSSWADILETSARLASCVVCLRHFRRTAGLRSRSRSSVMGSARQMESLATARPEITRLRSRKSGTPIPEPILHVISRLEPLVRYGSVRARTTRGGNARYSKGDRGCCKCTDRVQQRLAFPSPRTLSGRFDTSIADFKPTALRYLDRANAVLLSARRVPRMRGLAFRLESSLESRRSKPLGRPIGLPRRNSLSAFTSPT